MGRIKWKTPGSDTEHSIPDGARVTFQSGHGRVVVGFDDDGSIEYGKFEKIDDGDMSFYGGFTFSGEFGPEGVDGRYFEIEETKTRATDFLHTILNSIMKENREIVVEKIVERLLVEYPNVSDEFKKRAILDCNAKNLKERT